MPAQITAAPPPPLHLLLLALSLSLPLRDLGRNQEKATLPSKQESEVAWDWKRVY